MIDFKAWAACLWAAEMQRVTQRALRRLGPKPRWFFVKSWELEHAKLTNDAVLFQELQTAWASQVGSNNP
jgi:hypothetical protein